MQKRVFAIVILFAIICLANNVFSSPVSLKDAQKTAIQFYSIQKSNVSEVSITDTKMYISSASNMVSIFSFNTGGFVAISMDDSFKPILAYSLTGNHDLQNLSYAINQWFTNIADGMKLVISSENYSNIKHSEWESINSGDMPVSSSKAGLLTTQDWGQGCFYNQYCPDDDLGPCDHCVTGCTATAMAIIMKFWEYPQYGIGSHSYESSYGTLSANFGETEYNWANMPNIVTEENADVATLMYHCGVSVNMAYTGTTSGAALSPSAFFNYFGYSQNAVLDHQDNYTWTEWIALLENEIDNGRPVLYAGWEEMLLMGHAFVCDGYDALDYLHFNWGNDGSGNGYFLVPDEIAFPANNVIVRNIFPASDCDVKASEVTAPFDHTFTGSASIKVIVENYSNNPITDIPIAYSINNGTPVVETITETIDVLGSIEFEFATQYDFSQNPGMLHNVKVYTDLSCDTYRENDTVVSEILNVSCAPIPYSTSFDTDESRDGWLFEDTNNDGSTWHFSSGGEVCVYYQGGSITANDWLFSRCLELEANKLYKLSFNYKSTGIYWPQNIGISIGSGPESGLMLTSLDEITDFINDEYEEKEILFTVQSTDSYYLGFNCFSDPDMLNTMINYVSISELSETDIELNTIISPESSCELGSETVVVDVRNLCSQTLSDIPISYILDESIIVNETITDNILPGEYKTYEFETAADLSSSGDHSLKVYCSLVGDIYHENDTIITTIANNDASPAPYLCEFESSTEYENYVIENLNEDTHTWQFLSSGGNENPGCVRYDYNDFEAANDWLITKCIYLENGYIYKLSFWSKIEDASWPEKLEVSIGSTQTSGGMEIQLADYPSLTNSSFELKEITFPIPSDGYYYFGFRCYSDAQMFNLYIDDISVTVDAINKTSGTFTDNFFVFPNPARNHIKIQNINNNYNTDYKIKIYNTNGKVAMESSLANNNIDIDITNLRKGIYIIEISNNTNKSYSKFVKI